MTVTILLTTWNSSLYLAELLDSIISQTYTDWELCVRDDGSTDDTRDILRRYADRDARIRVMESSGKMGPKEGFMWLLAQAGASDASAEADAHRLYMFCDHDDVWLPEKVADCVKAMSEQPDRQQTPLLVGTDLRVVDARLHPIAESFWAQQHYALSLCNDKYFHLVYNNIPGCTMLFNEAARRASLPCPPGAQMHDSWLAACVLWNGGRILPLTKPSILYRQHQTNVLGSKAVPSYLSQLRRFPVLWRKTRDEWRAVRDLARMGFLRFFMIKMYYMARLHLKL
ncbi:MAG: glycosyltransferase [Bacteroidaceae bacterium]|nr:glycosyltransferase [Bacteroidaceae bacterium]